MKKIYIGVLLLIVIIGGVIYFKNTSKIIGNAPTQKVTALDHTCLKSHQYVVVSRARNGDVGEDILVKKSTENGTDCLYEATKDSFEINRGSQGYNEADYILSLEDNILVIDNGTGPQPRLLILFDLDKRKEVYRSAYSSINITEGILSYWEPTKISATRENCPELDEYTSNGNGSQIQEHVSLDLKTLNKTRLGELRCRASQ